MTNKRARAAASSAKRLHKKVKQTYRSAMPEQKRHRMLVWAAFFVVAAILAVQILYPLDRALPLARMNGRWVGWQSETDLANQATLVFQRSKIKFIIGGKPSGVYTLSEAGADIKAEEMASRLANYPFWLRLVPFSIFWQLPNVQTLDLAFALPTLEVFAQKTSSQLSRPPINAGVAFKDGQLTAVNDVPGHLVSVQAIKNVLQTTKYSFAGMTELQIDAKLQEASRRSTAFASVRNQAEQALARSLTIRAADQTFAVGNAEKASWLEFGETAEGGTTLVINGQKLQSSIDNWSKAAGHPAGQTNINIENGREVSRTTGEKGSQIDAASIVQPVTDYLLRGQGSGVILAAMTDLEPSVIYNNRYTPTEDGLRAYVRDKARNGAWFSIRQLGGSGWSADADAEESVVSASTYKLFVAKRLFDEINAGGISWSDPMLDTTVSGCFDRMTIASTNPCAVAWLDRFGRQNLNDFVYRLGFSRAVTFTHAQATHVSAGDLTKFMVGLETGSLISGAQRERLLYSLSHHPYRYGIPTGSQAREVYDKVGFLWNYVHDTAIVRHPRGTYVMTIMTQGKSYAAIAAMTRDIERIMYP